MSSCLSLRIKKPWWKSLTSKIQRKLHNKPKAITKTKNWLGNKATVVVVGPASEAASRPLKFSLNPRLRRATKRRALASFLLKRHRRRGPVYIDRLLKDHPTTVEKWLPKQEQVDCDIRADRTAVEPSKEADEAWESIGIASPLMQGIDARAEEFIAKFRADMEVQEMLASGL